MGGHILYELLFAQGSNKMRNCKLTTPKMQKSKSAKTSAKTCA